jgi:hypothetical protein
MEIFEILFLLAVWLLVSFLGWRKRSANRPPPEAVDGPWETMEDASAAPPTGQRGVAEELRDILRHLRGELLQEPVEVESRRPEPVAPAPATVEEVAPPEPRRPEAPRDRRRRRRRPTLKAELMRDLTLGSRSLARAVVLREVLGPPVALRESEGDFPAGR